MFAVGLLACPHCQSRDHEETGMPKITVHTGPSHAGEVEEWPGKPSSESPSSTNSSSTKSEEAPRKPARTTEHRSSKAGAESSSALSKSTTPGRRTAK